MISVILVLYLAQIGLPDPMIGLLLTLMLLGDTAISLWITTTADRFGRRKMLVIGATLLVLAGIVFGLTTKFWLLLAATIGVISPSGNEVGPFLSIEQTYTRTITSRPSNREAESRRGIRCRRPSRPSEALD